MKAMSDRARNYIAQIESISGCGGHTSLLATATALIRGFMIPEDLAFELLCDWNQTNAIPPWSSGELRHKLREAAKSDRPPGYLLSGKLSGALPPNFRPQSQEGTDELTKSAKRKKWPAFRLGSEAELLALAGLRHLQPGIPWLAQRQGLLRFATSRAGHECYVLTEGTMAQARRMDGGMFTMNESTFKSWSLPGSEGKWLGYRVLERHPNSPVLIVEGLVAWMEAAEAIERSRYPNWLPFAALSASVKLESRELDLLAGRQVIIARDRGEEGALAAVTWEESLAEIGVEAAIWTPPRQAKDLGEALTLPDFDSNSIFQQS